MEGPSFDDYMEDLLKEVRQQALTFSLGQVHCSTVYQHREYEPCPRCGAAV